MNKQPVFKSKCGKEIIISYYKKLLSEVDFEYNEISLETTFGKTYVLQAGNIENPPIILLHGSSTNCAMWFDEIYELSKSFYVLSIDIIGEAGNSSENRLDINSDDYAHWIKELLNNLNISKVSLVGNSYGGWLSLKFASVYPNNVEKMVLIASSGIVNAKLSFILKSIFFLMQSKNGIDKLTAYVYGTNDIPQEALEFGKLILENFNPMTGGLPIFSQNQLDKITSKTLFIYGEKDVTLDIYKAEERINQYIQNAFINIIPSCGHVVINQASTIKNFLKKG